MAAVEPSQVVSLASDGQSQQTAPTIGGMTRVTIAMRVRDVDLVRATR
jgi:hypothetical protein